MADPEHLRILQEQGVDAWNAWWRETLRFDLREGVRGTDLSRADLR